MKKIVLASILLFLTPKIFSQSLNCGYCDNVIIKGQPIYQVGRCGLGLSGFEHEWGIIKFIRINKYVEQDGFWMSSSIKVEENEEYKYQGKVYVNLTDAYNYKWRDILKNKGGIWDYSNYISCSKIHAYNLIRLNDQKAKLACSDDLEDHKEIKLTTEQIRKIIQEKYEK